MVWSAVEIWVGVWHAREETGQTTVRRLTWPEQQDSWDVVD